MIPSLVFISAGIKPESYFARTLFLKKHPKVYAAVAKRSVDAGAVSNEIWKESLQGHGDVFYVVKKSPDLPLDALVISSAVSSVETSRIQGILEGAEENKAFKSHVSAVKGYSVRDIAYYDTYRNAQQLLTQE